MVYALFTLVLFLLVGSLVLLAVWARVRAALREYYARPLELRWLDEPPAELGETGEGPDAELRELGYEPRGYLTPDAEAMVFFRIYTHPELPIYALLVLARDESGVYAAVPQLESFLEDGGRLSTTASPDYGRLTGGADTGGPRLVQLRAFGPATAAALDGQHVGTVCAWVAGCRRFLPADPDRLIEQMTQDHARLRSGLEQIGWVPLGDFLRAHAGRPRNVLRF